jgi:hypothetical protein
MRLIAAGHWRDGDPPILDAGMTRCGWLTSSRTCPCGSWAGYAVTGCCTPGPGPPARHQRPAPRHGRDFALCDPATWPGAAVTTTTQTTRYGTAVAQAWDRLHPG